MAAVVLLVAARAAAEDASNPAPRRSVALPQVTVEGDAPDDEPQAPLADPTSATTVVAARPGEGATVADLAAAAPGVSLREYGLNQTATISVRGSSSDQVAVVLDGLPLNSAAGGGVDLSTLPASFVERISVTRGAVGSRYGSGAMGGALLIETRRPTPGERRLFGELSYGSFASGEASAGAALSLGTSTSLLVSGFTRSSRGDFEVPYDDKPQLDGNPLVWKRHTNNDIFRAGGLARLLVEGETRFDLLLELDGGKGGLPGTLEAPTPHARQRDTRGLAVARVSRDVAGLPMELKTGARLAELSLSFDGEPTRPQDEAMIFAELNAHALLGSHILELCASAGGESLSTPFEHPFGEYGGGTSRRSHGQPLLAACASDEMRYGSMTFVPAVRADRIGKFQGVSPRLGAAADLSRLLTVKANAGRSFRAPSFGERFLDQGLMMSNPDLKPEHASFADLGLTAHRGGLSATATGFFSLYEDVILYQLNAGMRARPDNVGRAIVYGGELEGTGTLGPASLAVGYTLAHAENRVNDERYFGKVLPYHPRHRVHARAGVDFARWKAHAELDGQTEQFTNVTNTDHLDARARLSLGAGWLVVPDAGLWLQATARNVLNSHDQDLYGYPLEPFSILVSLRLDYDASHTRRIE